MLRKQLAAVHFGPQSDYSDVPEPLEARYMDWSLPPFNAGYHAYGRRTTTLRMCSRRSASPRN